MRKICYILALAVLGLMIYGCQIVIQSGQTPEETTQEQEEKPGPEVEPDTDPFLSVKNFNVFYVIDKKQHMVSVFRVIYNRRDV